MAPIIKLMSSDGQTFETDLDSIKCMGAVQTMISTMGIDGDVMGSNPLPIPVPNVRAIILRKLLTYANYHKNEVETSGLDTSNGEYICHWDAEFLNVTHAELFEIINGANYLDMKSLMNVACQTVANMMKACKPSDIRAMFVIPDDLRMLEGSQKKKKDERILENVELAELEEECNRNQRRRRRRQRRQRRLPIENVADIESHNLVLDEH